MIKERLLEYLIKKKKNKIILILRDIFLIYNIVYK